jgi:hypothetical protein
MVVVLAMADKGLVLLAVELEESCMWLVVDGTVDVVGDLYLELLVNNFYEDQQLMELI